MKQVLRIDPNETDADTFGNEWRVFYVLYQVEDDNGTTCFDLFTDDGQGNGNMICRGYNLPDMRHMALRLGEFVEWAPRHELLA